MSKLEFDINVGDKIKVKRNKDGKVIVGIIRHIGKIEINGRKEGSDDSCWSEWGREFQNLIPRQNKDSSGEKGCLTKVDINKYANTTRVEIVEKASDVKIPEISKQKKEKVYDELDNEFGSV